MDGGRDSQPGPSPTPAFAGSRLSEPRMLLTIPDVRAARRLVEPARFDTRDGFVEGQAGDFAVTGYGKERYPVRPNVFFGTYRVLTQFGNELVAERLVHIRRAWNVLDVGATMDYGQGRGVVSVERGSWLCQSDDGDYGTIRPDVHHLSHRVVGQEDPEPCDWKERVDQTEKALTALPPLLSLLALSAFVASASAGAPVWLAPLLIALELILKIIGGGLAWATMRGRPTRSHAFDPLSRDGTMASCSISGRGARASQRPRAYGALRHATRHFRKIRGSARVRNPPSAPP
jgi:hypothetical protein